MWLCVRKMIYSKCVKSIGHFKLKQITLLFSKEFSTQLNALPIDRDRESSLCLSGGLYWFSFSNIKSNFNNTRKNSHKHAQNYLELFFNIAYLRQCCKMFTIAHCNDSILLFSIYLFSSSLFSHHSDINDLVNKYCHSHSSQ